MFRISMILTAVMGLAFVSLDAAAERKKAAHSAKKTAKVNQKNTKGKKKTGKLINKKFGKLNKSAFRADPSAKCVRMYQAFARKYHTCMDKSDNKTQCGGCSDANEAIKKATEAGCSVNHLDGMIKDVAGMERKLGCRALGGDADKKPTKESEGGK